MAQLRDLRRAKVWEGVIVSRQRTGVSLFEA